jgi:hypothetical protein
MFFLRRRLDFEPGFAARRHRRARVFLPFAMTRPAWLRKIQGCETSRQICSNRLPTFGRRHRHENGAFGDRFQQYHIISWLNARCSEIR